MPSGMRNSYSVDVLYDDAMMRYARVVDVADSGVFVDLLCPYRRCEYVPFERLFWPKLLKESDLFRLFNEQLSPVPVEVLVPETKYGPWIWLPGELVNFGRGIPQPEYGGAVVHWKPNGSGEPCRDFLPIERIRWPAQTTLNRDRLAHRMAAVNNGSLHKLQDHIPPWTFFKRTVQLDGLFSVTIKEADALIKRFNSYERYFFHYTAALVDIVDDRLGYVYHQDFSDECDPTNWNFLAAVAGFQEDLVRMSRFSNTSRPAFDKMALPVELWLEVFSHLDTATQAGLRVVCAAWKRIMDVPMLRSRIIIRKNTSLDRSRFADFSCLATVYKRLQPGTHHIMMAQSQYRSWPITADMVRLCGMIHHMAQHHTGLRLASLRLSRFAFELQIDCGVQNISSASVSECLLHRSGPVTVKADVEPGFYRLQDFMAVCSSLPCSTIFMANCVVRLACCCFFPGFIGRERRICVEIRIPTARLPVRADFQWVLWDALEAVMLPPSDGELQKLSARMKSLEKNESNLKKVVCAMLCAMQSADRRPSTHYRGKKWCVDGLHGLQLEKLSSVTQYFLLQLHKMAAHSLSLAW